MIWGGFLLFLETPTYPPPTPPIWENPTSAPSSRVLFALEQLLPSPSAAHSAPEGGCPKTTGPRNNFQGVPFFKHLKHPQNLAGKMTHKDFIYFIIWVYQERSLVKIDLLKTSGVKRFSAETTMKKDTFNKDPRGGKLFIAIGDILFHFFPGFVQDVPAQIWWTPISAYKNSPEQPILQLRRMAVSHRVTSVFVYSW